jgi:hypothetical protein
MPMNWTDSAHRSSVMGGAFANSRASQSSSVRSCWVSVTMTLNLRRAEPVPLEACVTLSEPVALRAKGPVKLEHVATCGHRDREPSL